MNTQWFDELVSFSIQVCAGIVSGYIVALLSTRVTRKTPSSLELEVRPTVIKKNDPRPAEENKGPIYILKARPYARIAINHPVTPDEDVIASIFLTLVASLFIIAIISLYWSTIRWIIFALVALYTAIMFYLRNYYKFDLGKPLFTAAFLIDSFVVVATVLSLQLKIADVPNLNDIKASLGYSEPSTWAASTAKILGPSGILIWICKIGALLLSLFSALHTFSYALGLWIAPTHLKGSWEEFRAEIAGTLTKGQKYTVKQFFQEKIVGGSVVPLLLTFLLPVLLPWLNRH